MEFNESELELLSEAVQQMLSQQQKACADALTASMFNDVGIDELKRLFGIPALEELVIKIG
jgi:hypothetical protein